MFRQRKQNFTNVNINIDNFVTSNDNSENTQGISGKYTSRNH
jgi:hypothetical protein